MCTYVYMHTHENEKLNPLLAILQRLLGFSVSDLDPHHVSCPIKRSDLEFLP